MVMHEARDATQHPMSLSSLAHPAYPASHRSPGPTRPGTATCTRSRHCPTAGELNGGEAANTQELMGAEAGRNGYEEAPLGMSCQGWASAAGRRHTTSATH